MRTLAWLVPALAALSAGDAAAQQFKGIKKEESRIVIDLPELARHRELFSYGQRDDYQSEHYFASRAPRGGGLPHIVTMLDQLAPAFYWGRHAEINEATLRNWPFLKERQITDLRPSAGGGNEPLRIVPFRVENAACFAFEVYVGSPDIRQGFATLRDRQRVRGYFCGAPGTTLSDADTMRVLAGIKIRNPEGDTGLPLPVR